jgi:hypothetical protein
MLIYETLFVEDLERYPANAEVITEFTRYSHGKLKLSEFAFLYLKLWLLSETSIRTMRKNFYTVILGKNMSYVRFCRPKQNLCATLFTFSVELSYVEVNTEPFYV